MLGKQKETGRWQLGEHHASAYRNGKEPSWSAQRARFWKNEAHYNPGDYNSENLSRMERGYAPQREI